MADCLAVEKEDIYTGPEPVSRTAPPAPAAVDIDLGDIDYSKKKKKKSKSAPADGDIDLGMDLEDLPKKKKKSKTVTEDAGIPVKPKLACQETAWADDGRNWGHRFEVDDTTPTYDQMLDDLYAKLQAANPALFAERSKVRIRPPKITSGKTKSTWDNFESCCHSLKREMDHAQSFFLADLGTTGSINDEGAFIIAGRYTNRHIEGIMKKYIEQYIQCVTCKSLDTTITRDSASKLNFLCCNLCKSQRSVAAIKAGYQATKKGDRKAARDHE
jgi:translation initiation factor 2 subunit 2